jgi:hypothetical protein
VKCCQAAEIILGLEAKEQIPPRRVQHQTKK